MRANDEPIPEPLAERKYSMTVGGVTPCRGDGAMDGYDRRGCNPDLRWGCDWASCRAGAGLASESPVAFVPWLAGQP